jgi:V/A-type H+-transporting ATPase subunit K
MKQFYRLLFFLLLTLPVGIPAVSLAVDEIASSNVPVEAQKWGYLAAAIAVGASTLGAGIAVGLVGSSAMGAISERPEVGGRALIFLGLAEGIAIYGLIVAIMILGRI